MNMQVRGGGETQSSVKKKKEPLGRQTSRNAPFERMELERGPATGHNPGSKGEKKSQLSAIERVLQKNNQTTAWEGTLHTEVKWRRWGLPRGNSNETRSRPWYKGGGGQKLRGTGGGVTQLLKRAGGGGRNVKKKLGAGWG